MTSPTDKHEWRKREKALYIPKATPEIVTVPAFKFITLRGAGNPNGAAFAECIGALYSLAYGIKMTAKKPGCAPTGHYDYTVYPLEGVWDITDEAKQTFTGEINKDDLVYQLMLRQPDFVDDSFYQEIWEMVNNKKPHPLLDKVQFETIEEGPCIQMLHVGPYETEAETFQVMEDFAAAEGVKRLSKLHREIYLSDFRKTAPEKLKTVLRFQLEG
ncbi:MULTISPECIES: GyrI-like domain-containing protein [unclassified Lentimonas]|uniref:GyrI-like domain-containing protein n=1 Tax=unclassified Lentimonas TaxID=2630993 RepID=UPI00132169ED|nr:MULTISPECIES: GyrI-like domain-containing protein [unclassified Lentimonas]CAA6692806.1 Unannotated [Lentimonas sp. CC19]CAA6695028.1 Unannotated [Lentimonas sp. CC10]CAA7069641.1 Unannotated [Lentimonas sp. CC11]